MLGFNTVIALAIGARPRSAAAAAASTTTGRRERHQSVGLDVVLPHDGWLIPGSTTPRTPQLWRLGPITINRLRFRGEDGEQSRWSDLQQRDGSARFDVTVGRCGVGTTGRSAAGDDDRRRHRHHADAGGLGPSNGTVPNNDASI
jgi:hypothetical protein